MGRAISRFARYWLLKVGSKRLIKSMKLNAAPEGAARSRMKVAQESPQADRLRSERSGLIAAGSAATMARSMALSLAMRAEALASLSEPPTPSLDRAAMAFTSAATV